ncbi:tight adherence pilus pseudopilin TadF [Helicobacter sp. 11S03491-1]|uniref:tight adherence pilus pseudopilin TadF n=1 Tax=Helicobacter sp. 11S03491-1 TaxID=1476196 RepID=UPI0015DA7D12|nr:tight adherence pilus pseudopilin TadF [Helicobacter sp. 11S03491-1]
MKKQKPIFNNFITQTQGSISIEASIIFGLLILLIVLVGDIGKALLNQGKLDRLSYSLVSIIRERTLYDYSQQITSQEASGLYKILQNLQKDFIAKNSSISMKVEALYFTSNTTTPTPERTMSYDFGDFACDPSVSLQDYAHLSVKTSEQKYATLFRVSVCLHQKSSFAPIKNLISKFIPLQSSSIAPER